jgi:epoxyqueuosine reductase
VSATPELNSALLEELTQVAEAEGLLRLAVVRLDHPGFERAARQLDRHLDEGRHGEMQFMQRSRAARKDPSQMLPGARTLLVALAPYDGEPGPVARYAQHADYHTVLHRRLDAVMTRLRERLPQAEAIACVDTRPVMERAAAVLAGQGFLGKNGCLIAPGLGSYVLLASILCTARWSGPDAVTDGDRVLWDACGSCRACLDACPTQAFIAPGELDPRRCISYLTIEHRGPVPEELADRMGERIAGCDVCQEVCPYNAGMARLEVRRARAPAAAWIGPVDPASSGPPVVDLVALANIRSGRYRAFIRDTALRRIPRRSLRRNALLALSNRPGPLGPEERQAVEQAQTDEDPQVRSAALRVLHKRA